MAGVPEGLTVPEKCECTICARRCGRFRMLPSMSQRRLPHRISGRCVPLCVKHAHVENVPC